MAASVAVAVWRVGSTRPKSMASMHGRVEPAGAGGERLGALRERAVGRAQVRAAARRATSVRRRGTSPRSAASPAACREARRRAQPVGRRDGRVREVLLLAVPVHLPDRRVGRDEARGLLQADEDVGHLALHRRATTARATPCRRSPARTRRAPRGRGRSRRTRCSGRRRSSRSTRCRRRSSGTTLIWYGAPTYCW